MWIYIGALALVLIIAIAAFVYGFYLGEHSFPVKMKIALLKEENARMKCALNLVKLNQKFMKSPMLESEHAQ